MRLVNYTYNIGIYYTRVYEYDVLLIFLFLGETGRRWCWTMSWWSSSNTHHGGRCWQSVRGRPDDAFDVGTTSDGPNWTQTSRQWIRLGLQQRPPQPGSFLLKISRKTSGHINRVFQSHVTCRVTCYNTWSIFYTFLSE